MGAKAKETQVAVAILDLKEALKTAGTETGLIVQNASLNGDVGEGGEVHVSWCVTFGAGPVA